MRRIPYQFIYRFFTNVLHARYSRGPNKKLVKPMVAGFYVTMKCNFRCTYCDDGSGNMYPDIPEQRLNTARTIETLEILRRASPGINITGGGAAQNFEHFNRPGCVQPLLGNVRVHVARPVIA